MSDPREDIFVLRTPLLPLDDFLAWTRGADDAEGDQEARAGLREALGRWVERPEVREALLVASPSLVASLEVWRSKPGSKQGQQIERALVRYLSRMTSRPTPFGLCSGVSVGTLADRTELRLAPLDRITRAIALDGALAERLRDASSSSDALDPDLRLRVASTLFEHDGRLRYIEARAIAGRRRFELAEVESSPHIGWVLEEARDGRSARDLASLLCERDPEIEPDEALEFVAQLAEHQVLCPEEGLRVTGPSPLDGVLEEVERRPASTDPAQLVALREAREELRALEREPLGMPGERYQALGDSLHSLASSEPSGGALKIDLHRPLEVDALDASVRDELIEAARMLARISDEPADPLSRFRARFRRRYQERWVPLLEALDPDVGIGFDLWGLTASLRTPLLDGLPFVARGTQGLQWRSRKHRWLVERLRERAVGSHEELVLSDRDLEGIALRDEPSLPPAYHLIASLLPPGLAGEPTLWLRSGGGPSGVNLLGRFCHGSPRLERGARQHLAREAERHAPAVVAEVVHLPEARLLNVVGRPVLREYEIPVLGYSGAEPERRIEPSDLWVRLVGDRVVLASRRLGREVIPRLTSAHNHWSARNVGIYSFLCALQGQGMSTAFGWDWGPLAELRHLPRVRWRRVVLSPARWRLRPSELPRSGSTASSRAAALERLRSRLGLPRFVLLLQQDQELLVDLDNPLSVDSLLHAAETSEGDVALRELLQHGDSPVRGPEGAFVHELIIPVDGEVAPRPEVDVSRIAEADRLPRVFPPHAEWNTWRMYAAPSFVERTLVEDLLPWLGTRAPAGGELEWFFVRHGDPDWHLCLRFRGPDPRAVDELRTELAERGRSLVSRGRLWRIRTDTYVREVERYGGPRGMDACERIFVADSRFCSVALAVVAEAEDESLRWTIALWSIVRMLHALGLDGAERLALVELLRHNFGEEHGANDGPLKHALGRRYRALRSEVEALLEEPPEAIGAELQRADAHFAEQVRPEVEHLRGLEREGALPERLATIARSLLHMRLNRLLLEDARRQELVLFDLLARALRSREARRRRAEAGKG